MTDEEKAEEYADKILFDSKYPFIFNKEKVKAYFIKVYLDSLKCCEEAYNKGLAEGDKRKMKVIGAVTIGKLIEAHYEKDEHKFKSYAEFIADAYNEMGEERAERIIRSKIDGSYKNKPVVVTLDKQK